MTRLPWKAVVTRHARGSRSKSPASGRHHVELALEQRRDSRRRFRDGAEEIRSAAILSPQWSVFVSSTVLSCFAQETNRTGPVTIGRALNESGPTPFKYFLGTIWYWRYGVNWIWRFMSL
jgi:hypothetical protein